MSDLDGTCLATVAMQRQNQLREARMRAKILHLIIWTAIALAIIGSVSVPLVRAEQFLAPNPMIEREVVPWQWKGEGSRVNSSEDLRVMHTTPTQDRQLRAMVYGTGTLETRDEYLVGLRVCFRFKTWGELGRIIMGVFDKSKRSHKPGRTRVSIMLDGPDH